MAPTKKIRSRSEQTMARISWTPELIVETLRPMTQELGRMPSAREMRARGRNDLACVMTRHGGSYRMWATVLGVPIKDSETFRGVNVQIALAARLETMGLRVEAQPTKHPFDLAVEGVPVEVKSSKSHRADKGKTRVIVAIGNKYKKSEITIIARIGPDFGIDDLWFFRTDLYSLKTISFVVGEGHMEQYRNNPAPLFEAIAEKATVTS